MFREELRERARQRDELTVAAGPILRAADDDGGAGLHARRGLRGGLTGHGDATFGDEGDGVAGPVRVQLWLDAPDLLTLPLLVVPGGVSVVYAGLVAGSTVSVISPT
mgnify:CR=1 FL=1